MTIIKERLPTFPEKDYQPGKMRQLVVVLERWFRSIEEEIGSESNGASSSSISALRDMSFFLGR